MIRQRMHMPTERFERRLRDYLAALHEATSHPEQSVSMSAIRRHLPHEWDWDHHAGVMRSLVQRDLVSCERDAFGPNRNGYRLTERGRKMLAL